MRSRRSFLDRKKLIPGQEWSPLITDEIARCSHFVVFVSEATTLSPEVLREIDVAKAKRVKILPVVLGEPRKNPVAQVHAIRLSQNRMIESLTRDIEQICHEIGSLTGKMQQLPRPTGGSTLAPLLCDREAQADLFRSVFAVHRAETPDDPVALFVCGWDHDRPESFLERMTETLIRKYVVDQQTAAAAPVDISWPNGGIAASSAVNGVKYELLDQLSLPNEKQDREDENFIRHIAGLRQRGLIVVHTIRSSKWDPEQTPEALCSYLALWKRIGQEPQKPFAVLLFKVIYSEARAKTEAAAAPVHVRRSLEASVTQPETSISATIADDLESVTPEHVHEWFKDFAPHVPPDERKKRVDAMFKNTSELRMSRIEPTLRLWAQ
jgi:hypothetical protein